MKMLSKIIIVFLFVTLFSSCGVLTRARYGNGLKLNIENNWFGKKDQPGEKTLSAKPKKRISIQPIAEEENTGKPGNNISSAISLKEDPEAIDEAAGEVLSEAKSKLGHERELAPGKTSGPKKSLYNPIPVEPTAKWAGILFYGGIVLSILGGLAVSSAMVTIAFIMVLLGIILAFVGRKNIQLSGYAYRGYGLVTSIIVVFYIYLVLALISLVYLILILSLIL